MVVKKAFYFVMNSQVRYRIVRMVKFTRVPENGSVGLKEEL